MSSPGQQYPTPPTSNLSATPGFGRPGIYATASGAAANPPVGQGERPAENEPQPPVQPQNIQPEAVHPVGVDSAGRVRQSRSGRLWAGIVISAVLLVFLVVFIAQNSQDVTIKFLGFQGSISLAIGLILAAVVGVVVVSIPGSVRLLQLRRAVKKNAASLKSSEK